MVMPRLKVNRINERVNQFGYRLFEILGIDIKGDIQTKNKARIRARILPLCAPSLFAPLVFPAILIT